MNSKHLPLIALIAAVIGDRLITVSYWHLETNPFVMGLTRVEWILLSIALVGSLSVVWSLFDLHNIPIARWWMYSVSAFHGVIAVGNGLLVLGVL